MTGIGRNAARRCLAAAAALLVGVCVFALPCGAQTQTPVKKAEDGFVYLPGGSVFIGSPDNERQRSSDEVRHEVQIDPFYIDPHEVTQADYEAVTGKNPSGFKGTELPVERVTWLEAVQYCNALSQKKGLTPVYTISGESVSWNRAADGYRLLTEAEWEYAARAGTSTPFYVGERVHSDQINFQGSYPYLIEENYVIERDPTVRTSRNRGRTIPTGSLPPNPFGLYDMLGNVSEWVFDYYGPYDLKATRNPAGPSSGAIRVNRGGAYNDFGKHLRSACRSAMNPIERDHNLGFRIARNAVPGTGEERTAAPRRIAMPENPRILVAYYSYSGNTRDAAQLIAEKTGADLFEVVMKEPYWGEIYEATQKDMNAGVRPALASSDLDLQKYDVVLLGYPTWWATVPPPMLSFLENPGFAGKIVIPFSSHGGTEFGDSLTDLAKAIPASYVGLGLEFYYSGGRRLDGRINEWLKVNGISIKQ